MNNKYMLRLNMLSVLIGLALLATGCTTIHPMAVGNQPPQIENIFSHAEFDRVLQAHVDENGKVDYTSLKADQKDIQTYYQLISTYSPDSHPELFPDASHRLAYWINAYNAGAITIVLDHYPIGSVRDVKNPLLFFFLTDKAGFFLFQRLSFGGTTTSLYYLENKVIRKRFDDPRIHFALNCASMGCPRLPSASFSGPLLDRQLDNEARFFLSEPRNLRIDHREKAVYLSSIFKWFKKDFTKWYQRHYPDSEPTLLNYVGLYLPPDKSDDLKKAASHYTIKFIPYDWSLNDQNTSGADNPG